MINIQKIIKILFPNDAPKAAFIAAATDYAPPIPGEGFEDKLHNLIHSGNERSVQIILAPFLRERVYAYLKYEETPLATSQKQDYIQFSGNHAYEQAFNGTFQDFDREEVPMNPEFTRALSADFHDLRTDFIHIRGQLAWDDMLRNEVEGNEISDELCQLKNSFLEACAQIAVEEDIIDSRQLWNRIYNASAATQELDELRKHYIEIWGEAEWNENHTREHHQAEPLTLISDSNSTEEAFDLPAIPTAEECFIQKKKEYINKYDLQTWQTANTQHPVPSPLLSAANELKQQFIKKQGWKEWFRIHRPPEYIAAFDMMKEFFIGKWSTETWTLYSNANDTEIEDPENVVAKDFKECKQQFLDKCKDVPNVWELAKAYPQIPAAALTLLRQFKANFMQHWGVRTWGEHLAKHRTPSEYATDKQLKVLAELFDLRIEVTTINEGVEGTTQHFGDGEVQTIHLYCQDFTHYYVHEDGYRDTIGDGSCGYNGFAQWLQFLILGITPRRAIVLPDNRDTSPSSYILVQTALKNSVISSPEKVELDSSIQKFLASEEITVLRIHKELELPYFFATAQEFSAFLHSKTQELIRITRAKKLPYNRVPLVKKISTLVKLCGEQNKHEELVVLQNLLALIAKTLYLPNSKGIDSKWTDVRFKENITNLQTFTLTQIPTDKFQDLAQCIQDTRFEDLNSESVLTSLFAPKPQISYSNLTYHSFNNSTAPSPEEEDCLSAILCISGIFLLISGLACISGLILVGLVGGTSYLGLLLLNIGLQSLATTLGAVIGLSTANTAILVAVTGATMLSGLGFNLFKDFAPPSMLAHSPVLSMAPF